MQTLASAAGVGQPTSTHSNEANGDSNDPISSVPPSPTRVAARAPTCFLIWSAPSSTDTMALSWGTEHTPPFPARATACLAPPESTLPQPRGVA